MSEGTEARRLRSRLLGVASHPGRGKLAGGMAKDLIVSNPEILGGKPCVRGTRLSVEFLLELVASGAVQRDILIRYPQLTEEGLAAAFQYAVESLKGERTWEIKTTA